MAIFKSSNPVLTEKRFKDTVLDQVVSHENAMTVRGTMQKFGFLFLMVMGTAFYAWKEFADGGNVIPLILIGAIGGLIIIYVPAPLFLAALGIAAAVITIGVIFITVNIIDLASGTSQSGTATKPALTNQETTDALKKFTDNSYTIGIDSVPTTVIDTLYYIKDNLANTPRRIAVSFTVFPGKTSVIQVNQSSIVFTDVNKNSRFNNIKKSQFGYN